MPPVGLFGKLPSHPDFIRLNAGGPLARTMDEWMQEGMSNMRLQVGDGWETMFDRAAPIYFVYRDKDPSTALIGVSRASYDRTGRRYPFSVFAYAYLGRNGSGIHVAPQAFAPFLKAAYRIMTTNCVDGIDNSRAAQIMNLASAIPQSLTEYESRFDRYLSELTMESFWLGLYDDFLDRRKYLLMKNLFRTLAPRRGHDHSRFTFSLHLPTAEAMDMVVLQTAVWYQICRSTLGNQALERSAIFWNAESQPPARGCTLYFNTPAPKSVINLFAPGWEDGSMLFVDLMGAENIETARDELGAQLAGALDDRTNTMKDFIRAIAA